MPSCWFVGAILSVLLLESVETVTTESNVDILEPSLIRSPAMSQDPDDGFGWAAILHQTEPVQRGDSISEAIRKTRVIIGAPRGSYPGGLNLTDPELAAARRTGLVYSCPVGPGDCEGVRGNTTRYIGGDVDITNGFQNRRSDTSELFDQPIAEGRLFDQAPDSDSMGGSFNVRLRVERKSGQMMGSVLYSTGNTIVACAPRWVVNPFISNSAQPRGICFSGDRQLQNFRSELPCSGVGFSGSALREGYCSAGVSVTILSDQIHIGAPGYGQFGGAVYSRRLAVPITSPYSRTINHLNEELSSGRTIYHGIQVASGYVSSNDREQGPLDLLVAASRDNETLYIGRVYMYSIATLNAIQATPVAQGAQIAEFFGYSMALCDLTGDGYDELLVGAPMYTFLPEERGIDREIMPERGRVYVFYNIGGRLDFEPVILEGFVARSRFGLTIAKLGDIDADGHEDVGIGAPHEESSELTANTGAVYVYYGKDTREEFRSQTPIRIHGDDIVNNVDGLTSFRTFGFSISGNVDVDNNQYSDMVVGGYSDQAVVVLRSLPVANVTVRFDAIPEIRVDGPEPSFEVTLTASYDAIQVPGPLNVPFILSEVLVGQPRLFFTSGDPGDIQYDGIFILQAPNMEASHMLTVYAMSDFAETRPYQLQLDLSNVERSISSAVDGQQPISDLSAFPHIRQGGDNMATINLINPCGDDGCQSDVAFTIPTPSMPLTLLQGQDRSITFGLNYTNFGDEEARNVQLAIDFPEAMFQQLILSPKGQEDVRFDCVRNETGSVLCPLHERFFANQSNSLVLTLVVNRNGFIGTEDDFSVTLRIVVDTSSNNTDVTTTNNEVRIPFSVDAQSNINVAVLFGSDRYSYTGMSSSALNQGTLVTLFVTVDNTGPSTLQRASININFPSRVSMETDSLFYLYPNRILAMGGSPAVGTSVSCSTMGIDPNDLNDDSDFIFRLNNRRRRRSLPTRLSNKNAKGKFRMRRQTAATPNLISCNTNLCVNVMCDIQRLGTDGITFTLEFNIDERFYASGGGQDYSIRAEASASVGDGVMDDDPSDNSDSATVVLFEMESEVLDSLQLIHVIIWPTIGAVIILILFVTLLYYLGFFKRKTREEDEEVEDETVTKVADAAEITGL